MQNETQKKLLTLVIPTYNMEKFLPECLQSLVTDKELMALFEALVIIDGSTDRSAQIAQHFAELYPDTFRVIIKENGNYGSCINRGIDEARGTYIRPLDADDRFNTRMFEEFLKQLLLVDADMVISDYATWDMVTGARNEYHYQLPQQESFTIEHFTSHQQIDLMMHAATYRTSLLREMGYRQSEGISYTDQEWIFMPVTQVASLWYFPHILYLYRIGREGQTIDINVWVRHANEEISGLKKMTTFYHEHQSEVTPEVRSFLELRLRKRIESTYRHIFIRSIDAVDKQQIRELDQYLNQHLPQLYQEVEQTTTYHGLNVIGWWRRKPLVYTLYITIRKVASKLIKPTHKP